MNNKWEIVSVKGAIFKQDQWLVVKRSEKEKHKPGTLSLVGGKVESLGNKIDNILEKNLKREIKEEVGIKVHDNIKYVESKSFITDDGEPAIDIVFLCKHKSGQVYCKDKKEVTEAYWMTLGEILEKANVPQYVEKSLRIAEQLRKEYE